MEVHNSHFTPIYTKLPSKDSCYIASGLNKELINIFNKFAISISKNLNIKHTIISVLNHTYFSLCPPYIETLKIFFHIFYVVEFVVSDI